MILTIQTNEFCKAEKAYIFDWLFREIFGVSYQINFVQSSSQTSIRLGGSSKKLLVVEQFFPKAEVNWLSEESMPNPMDVKFLDPQAFVQCRSVPSIFPIKQEKPLFHQVDSETHELGIDIFGSIFFLVSRYEECITTDRDGHDRFPAYASLQGKLKLLHRPLANEWIEILWGAMKSIWPSIQRKRRDFRLLPSHDIDHPVSSYNKSIGSVLKSSVADAIKRRSPVNGIKRFGAAIQSKMSRVASLDPFDQIEWLLDQSEKHNCLSAFYYIPKPTHELDPGIPLNHPTVEDQWKRISNRSHEIGLHPGYMSFLTPQLISDGAERIRKQLERLDIKQELLGGRQHYLRWQTPETARYWDAAGLTYDSTLGFADRAGFRCGLCYEFPMYDLENRKPLKLVQRPLVAMECSVIDAQYMDLGLTGDAYNLFQTLKQECQKYQGDFTLLWHNTCLLTPKQQDFYQSLLAT